MLLPFLVNESCLTLVVGGAAERWHRTDLLELEDRLESKVHPFCSFRLAWRGFWIVMVVLLAGLHLTPTALPAELRQ
jgi:hypothetical protein